MVNNKSERILARDTFASNDTHVTSLNNNDLIVGATGASKTRGYVIPNLLQANNESAVVVDTKGSLYAQLAPFLKQKGFKVSCIDFTDLLNSPTGYNPFDFVQFDCETQKHCEQDIMSIATAICPVSSLREPYWEEVATIYLECLIAYVLLCLPDCEHNLTSVSTLVDYIGTSTLSNMFRELEELAPDSFCMKRYRRMQAMAGADKMDASIKGIIFNALDSMSFDGADRLFNNPERITFAALGKEKTIVFVNVSDTDSSLDQLISLFHSQCIHKLCESADNSPGSQLKVPVRLYFDDFASGCRVSGFEKTIATIRSREIYASIIIQSLTQLEGLYGYAGSRTIIDNCDTQLFLGSSSLDTAHYVGQKLNKTPQTVLEMPLEKACLFVRSQKPRIVEKYRLEDHPNYPELSTERSMTDECEQLSTCKNVA